MRKNQREAAKLNVANDFGELIHRLTPTFSFHVFGNIFFVMFTSL